MQIDEEKSDTELAAVNDPGPAGSGGRFRISRRSALVVADLVTFTAGAGLVNWVGRPAPVRPTAGWTNRARLPSRRGEMKATMLDGRLYVPGGLTGIGRSTAAVAAYEPATDTWESVAPMPVPLNHHAAVTSDGQMIVVGGNENYGDPPERHVYRYDPTLDTWETGPPMPDGRWGHEAIGYDGRVFVLGGVPETDDDIFTLVFDPATSSWERRTPIPTNREHVGATILGDQIVVVSGRWNGVNRAVVEGYDPATDSWQAYPPIPTPRSGLGVATVAGKLHVIGGEDPSAIGGWTTNAHEVYRPDTESWSSAPAVPLPLHGVAVAAIDDRLLVTGGAWRQGIWSVSAWSDHTFMFEPNA